MDINDRVRIRISDNVHYKKIKKEFTNNYYLLTMLYMIIYTLISVVVISGVNYLISGSLVYKNISVTLGLMFTMATMAKILKDDIVSNYWKLRKMKQRQVRGKK